MAIEGAVSAGEIGEGVVNVSANVLTEVGKIGNWLQALGIVVILWLIFQIVALIWNRRNHSTIRDLKRDIERLEKKIDKLAKRR